MEPIFGFALYAASVATVGVAASKRGLKSWAYVVACVVAAPVVVIVTSSIGGSVAAGFAAFLVPAFALFHALSSNTDARAAVIDGVSSEHRKCPYCAEAVRKEAIKCKHCGSELSSL